MILRPRIVALLAALLAVLGTTAAAAPAGAHGPPHLVPGPRLGTSPQDDGRRLLVRFRPGTPAADRGDVHRESGATVERGLGPERVEVVRIPRGETVGAALARYRSNPDVEFAEPNKGVSIAATPNDPFFPGNGAPPQYELWGLQNVGQDGGRVDADVDAPEAWDRLGETGSPWPTGDFAVGVVDTGAYANHEDLAGKIVQPCFQATAGTGALVPGCDDDNGHGTHVAGTIAAVGNNGTGIVGVAPAAKVYPCKALDAQGEGYDADLAACINEIVAKRDAYHIRVLSMSVSGPGSETVKLAVEHAWQSGVLVVAAAGNDGDSSNPTRIEYPAGYDHVVSVAATDRYDGHASFSNTNADVEVSAPGVDIVSTVPVLSFGAPTESGYAMESGTSMATPHAAAVAALIAARTGLSGQGLRDALDASVDDLGAPGRDPQFGFGRVNAERAMAYAAAVIASRRAPTVRTLPPSGYRIFTGSVYAGRGALNRLFSNDGRRLEIVGRRSGSRSVSDFYASTSIGRGPRASLERLEVSYNGNASSTAASVQLSVYDWSRGRWVSVDGPRRGRTSDRSFTWATTGSARRYVSSSGQVRFRVRGTRAGGFRTRTDVVRFKIAY